MQKKIALLVCLTVLLSSMAVIGCQTPARRPLDQNQNQNQNNNQAAGELTASERRVMASRLSTMAQEVDGVKNATVVVSSVGMTNNLSDQAGTDMNQGGTNMTPGTNMSPGGNMNQGGINVGNQNRTDQQAANNANPNTVQTVPPGTNVSGLVVMVGLTMDQGNMNPNDANNVKRTVANRLKASDQRISQVLVTTDPGMVQRLNDVAAGIIQGRPIQGYQDDLNDLTRRIRQQQPAF